MTSTTKGTELLSPTVTEPTSQEHGPLPDPNYPQVTGPNDKHPPHRLTDHSNQPLLPQWIPTPTGAEPTPPPAPTSSPILDVGPRSSSRTPSYAGRVSPVATFVRRSTSHGPSSAPPEPTSKHSESGLTYSFPSTGDEGLVTDRARTTLGTHTRHAPTTKLSLWDQALQYLSTEDQRTLDCNTVDKRGLLYEVIELTQKQYDLCEAKDWKITLAGSTIILRDVAASLVRRVKKFVVIGDQLVQIDPLHSSAPWGIFKFLLQVVEGEPMMLYSVIQSVDSLTILLSRCEIYAELYLGPSHQTEAADLLERQLSTLYACILKLLAYLKKFFTNNSVVRIATSIWTVDEVQSLLGAVGTQEKAVLDIASQAAASYQRLYSKQMIKNSEKLRVMLVDLEAPIIKIENGVAKLADHLDAMTDTQILTWLSSVPYKKHHERIRQSRMETTGNWFMEQDFYKRSSTSAESELLWLHGRPGAGKTRVTSLVIDTISKEIQSKGGSEGFAYFYCNRGENGRHDTDSIFLAILKQLCVDFAGEILEPVRREYKQSARDGFASGRWTFQKSMLLITELLDLNTQTTIIIDGLDECDETDRKLILDAIEKFAQHPHRVKLLISSREDHDIRERFQNSPNYLIQPTDTTQDINLYVDVTVRQRIRSRELLGGKVEQELETLICDTLKRDACGMFLWVELQIEMLCRLLLRQDVKQKLGTLPASLESTYREIFENFIGQETGIARDLAHVAIMWMVCSGRSLSPDELVAASIITLQTKQMDAMDADINLILRLCYNLLIIDTQLDIVRFAHLSVLEFFEKIWSPLALHTMSAEVCLYALNPLYTPHTDVDSLSEWGVPDWEPGSPLSVLAGIKTKPFEAYAIFFWQIHVRQCQVAEPPTISHDLLVQFLGSFQSPSASFLVWLNQTRYTHPPSELVGADYEWPPRIYFCAETPSVLPVACHFGLGRVINDLWEQEFDLHVENMFGSTLLSVASGAGHEWIVQLLLDRGANVNQVGGHFGLPLNYACRSGFEGVVKLLINRSADPILKIPGYYAPLEYAAQGGHAEVIRVLLKHGKGFDLHQAFVLAGREGHLVAASILVSYGVDTSPDGETMLRAVEMAAYGRKDNIIPYLTSLAKRHKDGAHATKLSTFGSCAAVSAARGGSERVLRSVFDAMPGVDLQSVSHTWGKTVLQIALERKSLPMANYVISHGADMKLVKSLDITTLEWAREAIWFPTLKSILESNGAEPELAAMDLFKVVLIFRKLGLPNSVAGIILDFNEMWIKTHCSRNKKLEYREDSKRVPYLQLPVPGPEQSSPLRKVDFTIKSNDQGFTWNIAAKGSYLDSWTWFEADVVTGEPGSVYRDDLVRGREIQRNITAISTPTTHRVTSHIMHHPSVRNWMESFPAGSIFGIFPRAAYPAWVNTVETIEIILYTAII